ncbi:MAG: Mrp/NBP35 family ATP-binding protein [Lachnospiraceae bacterium]|nr:Mrp/NBP35 family ATP-binding protein [Lachnospiraceae bacterium]
MSCDKSKCSSCSKGCSDSMKDLREPENEFSNIKKVIAVMSGKGGVGKSLVTSLLAVYFSKKGLKVGILDADITGPSIPKVFGIDEKAYQTEMGIEPGVSKGGIKVMSVNLILDEAETPVIWRGPLIAGVVKQFWTDVHWGELDVLLIDMPPGTGDVPLTIFQTIALDGAVIVTAPQDLVSMIVKKSHNMAKKMEVNVLGVIENMSYIKCDCGNILYPFGEGRTEAIAEESGTELIAKLPIIPSTAKLCDEGCIEDIDIALLSEVGEKVSAKIGL